MALSSKDRTEVQLLILQEVGNLLNSSSGFSEARRAVAGSIRELEAERLDHQSEHKELWGQSCDIAILNLISVAVRRRGRRGSFGGWYFRKEKFGVSHAIVQFST